MFIEMLGYVAGLLVVLSLLPQTIKSWKTKSTRDLSLWRYIIYCVGLVLWIVYAWKIGSGPVAVTNSIGLLLGGSILYLKVKHG